MSEPTTYSFGRRGGAILLGLDAPALVLAACLLVPIGLALLLAGIVGLVLAVVVSAAILYAPLPSGQPARQLVFRLARWAWSALVVRQPDQRVRSDQATDPQSVLPDGVTIDADGIIHIGDDVVGVWRLSGMRDFALLGADEIDRVEGSWGQFLDQIAGQVVSLSWHSILVPDPASEPATWYAANSRPISQSHSDNYLGLLSQVGSVSHRREILLVARIHSRTPKAASGDLQAIDHRLRSVDLGCRIDALSGDEVREIITAGAIPAWPAVVDTMALRGETQSPPPLRYREDTDILWTHGWMHRSFVASEFPRSLVLGDWLWPLLSASLPGAGRVAVSCHLLPLPSWRALRQAESAVTSAESELNRKQRAGFSVRSRDRLMLEAQTRREEEVASGSATYVSRISVTISGRSRAQLSRLSGDITAAARRSHLELWPATGAQKQAWLSSLPLGIVPPAPPIIATTRHERSLWPGQVAGSVSGGGMVIGVDALAGRSWCFDPWQAYLDKRVTGPNIAILGQIGRGKSALTKAILLRGAGVFGRRVFILDPKGEYAPLAGHLGLPVVRLSPGGDVRINPLEMPEDTPLEAMATRRYDLLSALAEAYLRRALTPAEATGLDIIVRGLGASATLDDIPPRLATPERLVCDALVMDESSTIDALRELKLALESLTTGRLGGMFSGRSTILLDSDRGMIIDLSPVLNSSALPVVLAAALTWLVSAVGTGGTQTYLVVDEAWAVLGAQAVDFLRSVAKLARSLGISLVLILHRLSDFGASGDDSSAVAKKAEGLFADVETVFCFSQPEREARIASEALGLSPREADLLPQLQRGRCLVRCGQEHALVDVVLTSEDISLTDTDSRMVAAGEAETA